MNLAKIVSVAVGLATWVVLLGSPTLGQSPPIPRPFLVFDGTLYSNKPDLSRFGIQPITIIYAGKFGPDWYKYADRLPSADSVKVVAQDVRHNTHMIVLDIEHWPLKGSPESVHNSVAKYVTVLDWFREAAPDLSVGYYGVPPIRDYWRAIKNPSNQERRSWMVENDQIRVLAGAVDVFFPSLYTFYPDRDGWKKYAIAQIAEARRYGNGKPVYVFLWPQYHESNRFLGGHFLPEDYWLLELETAKKYADGIVIWGGWGSDNRPAKWDENAAWWGKTKEFMSSLSAPTPLTVP